VYEYRVIRRREKVLQLPEQALERALNSYAADGWEYVNMTRWEAGPFEFFLIVFRRISDPSTVVVESTMTDAPQDARSGRPVPPSRRT